jgi:hypothetical protein
MFENTGTVSSGLKPDDIAKVPPIVVRTTACLFVVVFHRYDGFHRAKAHVFRGRVRP